MSDYFLFPQAINDLTEINDYLFANNQASADAFLDEISQKFGQLAQFPKMGRSVTKRKQRMITYLRNQRPKRQRQSKHGSED